MQLKGLLGLQVREDDKRAQARALPMVSHLPHIMLLSHRRESGGQDGKETSALG